MAESEFQAEPPDPARRPARRPPPDRGEGPDPSERRRPVRRSRREYDEDEDDDYEGERGSGADEAVATIIPYRNPLALTSYYLGVFSLIPCVGLLLGPAALILGIFGIRASRRSEKAHGMGHAIAGIVLGSIASLLYWGIVVAAVVAGVLSKH